MANNKPTMTRHLPFLCLLLLAFGVSAKVTKPLLSPRAVTASKTVAVVAANPLVPVVAAVKKTGKPAASRLPFTMSITKLYTPAMKGKTCVLLASSDLKTWNTLFAFPYSANPTNIITLPFQGRQFYKMEAM